MAETNYGMLTGDQLQVWSRKFWRAARNNSFTSQFLGSDENSMIQRVTELTGGDTGTKANITLLADNEGDGVAGDAILEGNEEALNAHDTTIEMDQLRFAHRLKGRITDQKSVVNFRNHATNNLSYQAGDRIDQMAFLTMSGIEYIYNTNGSLRPVKPAGQNLSDLEFASDVSAPTSDRTLRVAGGGIELGDTSLITATDKLGYRHIVEILAYAKDNYIRGVKSGGNQEVFHMFVTPKMMKNLKLDPDFIANMRNAGVRGDKNPLFAGSNSIYVDGVLIHEFRHVFSNEKAGAGNLWGSGSDVVGGRALFCGAQALAMADIGNATFDEDEFDYKNSPGISIGKIFGFRKPTLKSLVSGSDQDFGVITLDTAI
jgi:N4-gp56 family major capsid protein